MVMIPVKGVGKVPDGECEGEDMVKQKAKSSAETVAGQQNNEPQNPAGQDAGLEELTRENAQLRESVARLEQEKEALQERALRIQADGENFRKRITREKEEFARYAKEEFIMEILPIKDNLERALEHGSGVDNPQAIIDGVNMILEQFSSIFEKMGVSCLTCCGER
ncbi:MAG TPA: nucleotide exchange factor GrpE, partial [Desulfobulbaceae bacterium]|nr:nucleotide exchange factor GrpE [Desulfobulbaceae bacterium]